MSARLPQHADHSFDSATHTGHTGATLTMTWRDARPYAVPNPAVGAVDAMLIDAIRAAVGPYVPAPIRVAVQPAIAAPASLAAPVEAEPVASVDASQDDTAAATPRDLPWIDSFLDASATEEIPAAPVTFAEAAPVVSIFAAEAVHEATSADVDAESAAAHALFAHDASPITNTDETPAVESSVADASLVEASDDTAASVEGTSDEWPLAEAGAAMEALAQGLAPESVAETADSHESLASDDAAAAETASPVEPMPMWADDDLMDIMPVRRMRMAGADREPWADQVRRQGASGGAEAAAIALESLARRVRDGELVLPGYSSEMGEPAALAAALAALLGVRQ